MTGPNSQKTFLIVDDSPLILKISRQILEKLGFKVIEAKDGQEALKRACEDKPVAVLLDWEMPIMNGLEFLKKFRSFSIDPCPKVIFCTSQNTLSQIQTALETGADEYIMKPFDEKIITEKLIQVGLIDTQDSEND